MYGKIFDSIYDGTLRAHWQGLITFQQLIILANKDGIIDMTPHAIHGRTGIPLEIIESGLDHLSKPDPYSRSIAEEGRRIVLIDDQRPWGWRLVNHAYYNRLRSAEEKRIADRERAAEKRGKSKVSQRVAKSRKESREVAEVAPVAVAVAVDIKPTDDSIVPEFQKFWDIYPKREGANPRKPAFDVFVAKVKKGTEAALIIRGAGKYASECQTMQERKYVAQAVTWLRQERWNDAAKPVANQFRGAK